MEKENSKIFLEQIYVTKRTLIMERVTHLQVASKPLLLMLSIAQVFLVSTTPVLLLQLSTLMVLFPVPMFSLRGIKITAGLGSMIINQRNFL